MKITYNHCSKCVCCEGGGEGGRARVWELVPNETRGQEWTLSFWSLIRSKCRTHTFSQPKYNLAMFNIYCIYNRQPIVVFLSFFSFSSFSSRLLLLRLPSYTNDFETVASSEPKIASLCHRLSHFSYNQTFSMTICPIFIYNRNAMELNKWPVFGITTIQQNYGKIYILYKYFGQVK